MTSTTLGATSRVDTVGRIVEGLVVPYNETSYLTGNPAGERVMPGAFAGAVGQAEGIFLFRSHDHTNPIGRALSFTEQADGLHGTFWIRESPAGDLALADLKDGYLPGMSVGFRPTRAHRGPNGETVIVHARLMEVSLVPLGAYDSAKVLALRAAHQQTEPIGGQWTWHAPASLAHLLPPGQHRSAATYPQRQPRPVTPPADTVTWHLPPHLAHLIPHPEH